MWDSGIECCKWSNGIAPRIHNSTLDGVLWSASRSGHFIPTKEPRYPLNKRLCGPLSWPGCLEIVVNQYCLFFFSLFTLACVALLKIHLKVSQHMYRDSKIKILAINRRKNYSI
jgi:hypothetical protein